MRILIHITPYGNGAFDLVIAASTPAHYPKRAVAGALGVVHRRIPGDEPERHLARKQGQGPSGLHANRQALDPLDRFEPDHAQTGGAGCEEQHDRRGRRK